MIHYMEIKDEYIILTNTDATLFRTIVSNPANILEAIQYRGSLSRSQKSLLSWIRKAQ